MEFYKKRSTIWLHYKLKMGTMECYNTMQGCDFVTNRSFAVRIADCTHYVSDRWNDPYNLYSCHTMYCVIKGKGHAQTGGRVIGSEPGNVCLIPAHTIFACRAEGVIEKIYIEFFQESSGGGSVSFKPQQV